MSRGTTPARALALALAGTALPAFLSAQQYTLRGERAAIYNLAGHATLEPASGAEVTVAVTTGGSDAAKLELRTLDVRGRAALVVRYPDDRIVYDEGRRTGHSTTTMDVDADGTFGGDDDDRRHRGRHRGDRVTIANDGRGLEAHADLRIGVPKGRSVAVYLGVGKITATNVDGDLRLDLSSGTIDARDVRGAFRAETGSGDVDLAGGTGDVHLETGSGNVTLRDTRDGSLHVETGSGDVHGTGIASAGLEVETGSGEITLERVTTPRAALETGSGDVRLLADGDVRELAVSTGSGNVVITAAGGLHGRMSLESGSGELNVAVPFTLVRKTEDSLEGTVGDGKGRIRIETGSGDITLKGRS